MRWDHFIGLGFKKMPLFSDKNRGSGARGGNAADLKAVETDGWPPSRKRRDRT